MAGIDRIDIIRIHRDVMAEASSPTHKLAPMISMPGRRARNENVPSRDPGLGHRVRCNLSALEGRAADNASTIQIAALFNFIKILISEGRSGPSHL